MKPQDYGRWTIYWQYDAQHWVPGYVHISPDKCPGYYWWLENGRGVISYNARYNRRENQ